MKDQWLVRTSQNSILGPYTSDQIRQMIQTGKLKLQDELCKANGFWIFIHERYEIRDLLGIEVPQNYIKRDDDITQTDTETGSSLNWVRIVFLIAGLAVFGGALWIKFF